MRLRDSDLARIREAITPEPAPAAVGWLEKAVHRRIRVHTKADQTFDAVLREECVDGLLLWSVTLHTADPDRRSRKSVKLDGEVFIPRGEVLFVQTLKEV